MKRITAFLILYMNLVTFVAITESDAKAHEMWNSST